MKISKRVLFFAGASLAFMLWSGSHARAQDVVNVTKSDIIATIKHEVLLTQDAINQANAAKQETKSVQVKYDAVTGQRDWWQAKDTADYTWGSKNEVAVKHIAELLALFLSAYIGTVLAGQILKNFPALEGWAGCALVYAAIFLGFYYLTASAIYCIPSWVPTPPLLHDVTHAVQNLHMPKL